MSTERTFPLPWNLTGEDALVAGSTWRRRIQLYYVDPETGAEVVWDTTGYTAVLTIRDDYDGTVLLSATSADGEITVGDPASTVIIDLAGSITGDPALAPLKSALGVWDLWLTDAAAQPTMVYTGRVALEPRVTS